METNKTRLKREAQEQKKIRDKEKRTNLVESRAKGKKAKPYLVLLPLLFKIADKIKKGGGSEDELPIGCGSFSLGDYRNSLDISWDYEKKACSLDWVLDVAKTRYGPTGYYHFQWIPIEDQRIHVLLKNKDALAHTLFLFASGGEKNPEVIGVGALRRLLEKGLEKIK